MRTVCCIGPAFRLESDRARQSVTDRIDEAKSIEAGDPRRVAASIAMFERLSEHWTLRRAERETLLGGVPKSTWSEWRQRPALTRLKSDTRERIANLFSIDLNAHSLFAPEFADRWVREPNAAFQGQSPITVMLQGRVEDIIVVRRYLERIRTSSPDDVWSSRGHRTETVAVSYLPDPFVPSDDNDAARAEQSAASVAVYVTPAAYAVLAERSLRENRDVSAIIAEALDVRTGSDG